jgi:hypothetical protein
VAIDKETAEAIAAGKSVVEIVELIQPPGPAQTAASKQSAADRLKALGAVEETVGEGTTKRVRKRLTITSGATSEVLDEVLKLASESQTWEYQRDGVAAWLEKAWPLFSACPSDGKRAHRCCGAHGKGEQCFGPNWREREDLEWYIGEVQRLLTITNEMVRVGNAKLAASYAVELGQILAEAKFKDRWEGDALAGRSRREGLVHKTHPSPHNERIAAFESSLEQNRRLDGKPLKMRAYRDAAAVLTKRYGIPIGEDAIRAAVGKARK